MEQEKKVENRGARRLAFILVRIIGLLFVVAGVAKSWDPAEFAREVSRYQLVPWSVAVVISLYLPWLEILSGLLLFFRKFERGARLIMVVLLLVFTLALASAWGRGINIDCGCFGPLFASTGTLIPLIRNLVLLGCFLWIHRLERPKKAV